MYGLLFDATMCVGCEACVEACKKENGLPDSDAKCLSSTDFTILEDRGDDQYLRRMCYHCVDPSCASACPVGALKKTADGPVVYDYDLCMGCRYCMVACPFGIPRYEWDSMTPRVMKCQMCPQRVSKGKPTACAEECPTEATLFGEREELLAVAQKRIAEQPDVYDETIYGLAEAGGTCVFVIGPKEIMAALNHAVPKEKLPERTWAVLSQIPKMVGVVGVGLVGVGWVIKRRMELAEKRAHGLEETGEETREEARS
jgi:formate dehydrogenase iron-sulfur subunit